MIDQAGYEKAAQATLDRIQRTLDDEVDPDMVEAVPSSGVVRLDWQGKRRDWVVNSQSAARQIWLAAEQRAWHFAPEGDDPAKVRWICAKSGDELFTTISGLLREHAQLEVDFGS